MRTMQTVTMYAARELDGSLSLHPSQPTWDSDENYFWNESGNELELDPALLPQIKPGQTVRVTLLVDPQA